MFSALHPADPAILRPVAECDPNLPRRMKHGNPTGCIVLSMQASSDSLPSRRRFLKTAASAIGAPFILPSGSYSKPLNSMLQVATVGADGMAHSDMMNFGSHPKVKFVGFCDIDSNRFAKADKE